MSKIRELPGDAWAAINVSARRSAQARDEMKNVVEALTAIWETVSQFDFADTDAANAARVSAAVSLVSKAQTSFSDAWQSLVGGDEFVCRAVDEAQKRCSQLRAVLALPQVESQRTLAEKNWRHAIQLEEVARQTQPGSLRTQALAEQAHLAFCYASGCYLAVSQQYKAVIRDGIDRLILIATTQSEADATNVVAGVLLRAAIASFQEDGGGVWTLPENRF